MPQKLQTSRHLDTKSLEKILNQLNVYAKKSQPSRILVTEHSGENWLKLVSSKKRCLPLWAQKISPSNFE